MMNKSPLAMKLTGKSQSAIHDFKKMFKICPQFTLTDTGRKHRVEKTKIVSIVPSLLNIVFRKSAIINGFHKFGCYKFNNDRIGSDISAQVRLEPENPKIVTEACAFWSDNNPKKLKITASSNKSIAEFLEFLSIQGISFTEE